ncbi:O-acyltransferase like protein isoform X2 [Bicyclus anynana]|uniref:O-acyltransferase like protein isoform X2 n=1 Tax=Bicyclus anynana TaxID=110368 RepID=A0A6J1MYI5_BICAN|nr:O-acyltransferase like protein isoform X2 [Bicyclus anynana]
MCKLCFYLVFLCFGQCFGVIYHLNETEYEKLPRLSDLENYEKCMEESGGIYCVAHLELYNYSNSKLYTLIREYSDHALKHYNYTKLDRGICVTQTCKNYARNSGLDINRDLAVVLEGCLNETMIKKYGLSARVYNKNCDKKSDKNQLHIDFYDYVFLGVFVTLLMLALIGSFCEVDKNQKKEISGKTFIACFSVPENYKQLTAIDQSDPRMSIFKSAHAFRTLASFFIVHAHVGLMIGSAFTADPHTFEKAYESAVLRITFSGMNIVQYFFFMTGLLLTYITLVKAETHRFSWKIIPTIIVLRWWRLTPSAAMVVAFSATWMRHLGSGPLWTSWIVNGSSHQCRRYFWAHIFYVNNYIPEDVVCVFQTWYIAADTQIFIAAIVIHFAIRNRSTKFKTIALTALLLLSMASPALHVWWQDLDAFSMQKPDVYRTLIDDNFRRLHVLGHNNLGCCIVGLATGHLIYWLQQNKIQYPNFRIGNLLCWCVIPMFIVVLYFSSLFIHDGERPSLALRMLFAGTNRALFGFIAAFWAVGVVMNFNGCSKAIMEWPGWVVPGRLSYGVYLLHNIFIELGQGMRTQLVPVSFYNMCRWC